MPARDPDNGSSSKTVAENVRRLRTSQNMNFKQLSERLRAVANWDINPVGIRRIENGERRVTPDDLVALALAFGVSPISLLLPGIPREAQEAGAKVEVTGVKEPVAAGELWNWLKASITAGPPSWAKVSRQLFEEYALPEWEKGQWMKDTPDGDD